MRPTLARWVWINLKIGALSFGGSGRIFLFQEAIVDQRKWMEEDEFREILTLAQVFPGNLINLSIYLGRRLVSAWAAFLGLLALALPGAFVIVALAVFFNLQNVHVRRVFQGFSLGSVAVFAVFMLRLFAGLRDTPRTTRLQYRSHKIWLRIVMAVGVAVASLLGQPLTDVLLFGSGAALLIEFGVKDFRV